MSNMLESKKSFKDVIINNFEDEIHNFIETYVDENYESLDFDTNLEIDEVMFASFNPKFITITSSKEDILELKFTLVVEIYVEVKQRIRSDIVTDDCTQWLSLDCGVKLGNGKLKDFQICGCGVYIGKNFDNQKEFLWRRG